jgi:hypothetical protein
MQIKTRRYEEVVLATETFIDDTPFILNATNPEYAKTKGVIIDSWWGYLGNGGVQGQLKIAWFFGILGGAISAQIYENAYVEDTGGANDPLFSMDPSPDNNSFRFSVDNNQGSPVNIQFWGEWSMRLTDISSIVIP